MVLSGVLFSEATLFGLGVVSSSVCVTDFESVIEAGKPNPVRDLAGAG